MNTSPSPELARPHVPAGAVVVGYDGRPPADLALQWAAREALASRRPLVVVHVLTMTPMRSGPAPVGAAPQTAPAAGDTLQRTAVDHAADQLAVRFPQLEIEQREVRGDPTVELVGLSRDAGLLVVGSRGTGVVRKIPSAQVGTRVARTVACPMVVVPHHNPGVVRRGVLAGISVRRRAPEVLERAFAFAEAHDLPLTIVHASSDTLGAAYADRVRWLAEATSGFTALHPNVRVEQRVDVGRPTRILLDEAESMELLVVGQHATVDANPLGHVRSSIVDRSPCPVMVVPPPAST